MFLPGLDPEIVAEIQAARRSGALSHPWREDRPPACGAVDIQEWHNYQRFRLTARAQACAWLLDGDAASRVALETRLREWLAGFDAHWDVAMQPINVSLRIREWLWVLMMVQSQEGWPTGLTGAMLDSLQQQARRLQWMIERETPGNHPLINLAALWSLAVLAPTEVRPGRASGLARELERETLSSFLPDGFHVELATHYHVQVLRVLEECLVVSAAVRQPLGEELQSAVAAARRALCHVRPRTGALPLLGDSCYSFYEEDLMADVATLASCRPDEYGSPWHEASSVTESMFWMRALAPREAVVPTASRATMPGGGSAAGDLAREPQANGQALACHDFPDAGYLVSHWGQGSRAGYFLFDAGPLGYRPNPGHGHADLLHFVLYLEGQPLLVDPGTLRYGNDPVSLWFKRARAHNTLALAEAEPADLWRFFRWCDLPPRPTLSWSCREGELELEACSSAYRSRHGTTHVRRCLLKCAGELTVHDEIVAQESPALPFALSYHFDPRWSLRGVGPTAWFVEGAGRVVRIIVQCEAPLTGRLEQEPVATRYGQAELGPVLRLLVKPRAEREQVITRFHWA